MYIYIIYLLFYIGVDTAICVRMSLICCPQEVELAIDNATFANTRNMIPLYSLYLNEDGRIFSTLWCV